MYGDGSITLGIGLEGFKTRAKASAGTCRNAGREEGDDKRTSRDRRGGGASETLLTYS